MVSIAKINVILLAVKTMNPLATNTEIALEIKQLNKSYGRLQAVKDLSLTIRKGEVFGFLGPNGAGKTTSIRMMCGLLKADSGSVLINGKSISTGKIKSGFGICPQNNVLWNRLNCFEQLLFIARMYDVPGKIARSRAEDLLSRIGLLEKRNRQASTLSGGMKRRMNVIMALMHDPEIVVFDEPEAGLDPQSRILVREFIREIAEKKTVIFTTHNMDEADRVSDRVAIIDRGSLLQLDTPENLKRSIGEGDVLELILTGRKDNPDPYEFVQNSIGNKLADQGINIVKSSDILVLRGKNLVSKIPGIYSMLESAGLNIQNMQMRENSLEDVFIHLTGRRLRQ